MTYALYADEWPMAMIRQRLDRSDRHLFTELLAHCTRNLTDGVIDVPLAMITDHDDAQAGVEHLIDAGMLERIDDGLVISEDWWKNQRSREQVEKYRTENRKRYEAYKDRGARHKLGDHRTCTSKCPQAGKDLRSDAEKADDPDEVDQSPNAVSNAVSNGGLSISSPSPTRKGGEGEKEIQTGSDEIALRRDLASPVTGPLLAKRIAGVHVFFDPDRIGSCAFCNQPEKARGTKHQYRDVPDAVLERARDMSRAGLCVYLSQDPDHLSEWTLEGLGEGVDLVLAYGAYAFSDHNVVHMGRLALEIPGISAPTSKDQQDQFTAAVNECLRGYLGEVIGGDDPAYLGSDLSIRVPISYVGDGGSTRARKEMAEAIAALLEDDFYRDEITELAHQHLGPVAA